MLTFTEAIDDISKASTMYVRRQLLNAPDIVEWAKSNGFETTLDPIDMHVTVAFSRAEMDWPAEQADGGMSVDGGKRSLKRLGAEGDAVVLTFEAFPLTERWKEFRSMGASWDWPSYQPHVTISYNTGDIDVSAIRPYIGPLQFGPEIFEPVKEDWKTTITEKAMTEQIDPRVMDYLAKNAPEILAVMIKLQPGAADVHVASAGKGKKKPFKATLEEQRRKRAEGSDLDDGKPVDTYKSEEWSMPLEIVKTQEDQQLVFGWASVSEIEGKLVIDKQDDVILPEDLESAAYEYLKWLQEPDEAKVLGFLEKFEPTLAKSFTLTLNKRSDAGMGYMHESKVLSVLIESMVFTKQKQELLGIDLGLQGWWVGWHVSDKDMFLKVKNRELPELSIGGRAVRVPVE